MAWRMEGTYFENCSCDMICPCSHSGLTMRADYERCRVLLAFHIASGDVDGVDVGSLNFALLADTPPLMADGNWRVGLFLDAAASEEQRQKLGAVLGGELGGPPAMLAPLIGEMPGVEVAPIEFTEDGRRHRVRIGDAEIEVEDFVAPGGPGEPVRLTNVFHPANTTLTAGRATTSRVSAFGLEYTAEGQSASSAPFAWSA